MQAQRLVGGMTVDELLAFHRAHFGDTRMEGEEGSSNTDGKPETITMTSAQLAERLARAKPADYDDLKAKAARLDEIEAANKSEVDKARDAAATAETERDKARAEAMRLRIAAKHGISDDDADLFLTGADEATLTKQATALASRSDRKTKTGNFVPAEGTNAGEAKPDAMREFARQLFGKTD